MCEFFKTTCAQSRITELTLKFGFFSERLLTVTMSNPTKINENSRDYYIIDIDP